MSDKPISPLRQRMIEKIVMMVKVKPLRLCRYYHGCVVCGADCGPEAA